MKVEFPGLTLPGFRIYAGQLLNIVLFGVGLVIPPWSITFWRETVVWKPFTFFDSEWIAAELSKIVAPVAEAVWSLFEGTLDRMAAEYYKSVEEGEE